jgi:transglutaminase-like putative cysteine protease
MWDKALDRMVSVGIELNHFLGGISGEARGPNLLFTPTQTLRDRWDTSSDPMFTAVTDDGRAYKWRGMTYEYFDGGSWQNVEANDVAVPANQDLQAAAQTNDASLTTGRKQVRTGITPIGMGGRFIVAPGDPFLVDQPATVETNSVGGLLGVSLNSELAEGSTYVVTSRVFYNAESGAALTAADLAGASVNYGPAFKPYVEVQPNSVGPVTLAKAQEIIDGLDPSQRDPYHKAIAVRDYLLNNFNYTNDITGLCTGQNRVDCFLTVKKGFCEGFATAMAMMLRTQQVPTRYVTGFLPGQAEDFIVTEGEDIGEVVTRRVVTRSASHAWVEVYFPGYGWYPFDPTPGLDTGEETAELPPGSPRATASDDAPTQTPNFEPTPSGAGVLVPPVTTNNQGGESGVPTSLALGVFVAVLAVAAGLILFARRRRLPGGGQMTYDSVARIATRFGYAPVASQTAYEYADRLALVVPSVRDELRVVATAKVESVYARREPSEELKVRLMIAYRRVRMSLVRLFVRRPHWVGPRWRH